MLEKENAKLKQGLQTKNPLDWMTFLMMGCPRFVDSRLVD